MARRSLLLASMFLYAAGLTGCLDAAPEYAVPEKLPPILDAAKAGPAITSLVTVANDKPIDLSIPMSVGEGAGRMQMFFIANYGGGDKEEQVCVDNPPRGDAVVLNCEQPWQSVPLPAGCHTITVLVSYADNFSAGYKVIEDPSLATQATWFVGLGEAGQTCLGADPGVVE